MTDLTMYIDRYCERVTPDFWAEPLNAMSNAAFLLAAFCAFLLARRNAALDWPMVGIIATLCAIGIGSFLFHTLATGWAMLADTLPILVFQIGFLLFYAVQVMRLGWFWVGFWLLLFSGLMFLASLVPQGWFNGSIGYLPALLFLFGLGVYHRLYFKPERFLLFGAALVFAVSLGLRTLDSLLCPYFAIGTHVFWHCLNALVVYMCLRALVVGAKK